jgi:glycosyltransferase involved in cell wall biosynthesis
MSSQRPLVSIVTATLNQGQFIGHTISSVDAQTYSNVEHIVRDGGSTDGTLDILTRAAADHRRWTSAPDSGMYDAVNQGLRSAHGEICAYLNSDDLYLPWTLDVVVDFFARRPDADLVYGDALRLDERDGSIRPFFQHPFDPRRMVASGSLIQPAVFWRRRVNEEVGEFDASLRYSADLDFWLRCAAAGMNFARIDEILAVDRAHEASLSLSQYETMAEEIRGIRAHHLGRAPTRGERLVGRARREAWAARLWLAFGSASRRGGRSRRWARILDHLAEPVTVPASVVGSMPKFRGRVQSALGWDARLRSYLRLEVPVSP